MLLILILSSLLLVLLSPFLGLIFILAVGGRRLLRDRDSNSLFFAALVIATVVLFITKAISILEVGDVIGGIVIVTWIFFRVLRERLDYQKAFLVAGLVQLSYSAVRTLTFGSIYRERIQTLFAGYDSIMKTTFLGTSAGAREQLVPLIEQMKSILIDYQSAIWSLTMLLAMYLGALFLSKKLDVKWEHRKIRFPFWISYFVIGALALAILPTTRVLGLNALVMMSVFFVIQGLAITDYWSGSFLKSNRIAMIAIIFLMIVNVFFAIMIALLGLIDYWLDIRKINQ